MQAAPATERELDSFRERADRLIAELDEEFYLHFSGQKAEYEVAAVYERHAELAEAELANRIGAAVDGRRNLELWRFACETHLGHLVRDAEQRVAEAEAALAAELDGERIPYRMLIPAIANSEDRGRSERLEHARNELSAQHLNPILEDAARRLREAVPVLGSPTYADLYRRFAFGLDRLAEQARGFLDETETLFERALDRTLRETVGVPLAEAERWDARRAFRATAWDRFFPGDAMLPALRATLGDLGIDLDAQRNVELDVEPRPTKTPRAFCVPIEIPDRVVLMIQPTGGADDWRALFHEAGHTEHYANASHDLLMEEKRLGDMALTETWAQLLERLTGEPAWLDRRLDFPRADEFAAESAVKTLWLVRRYCAKLLYELELHGGAELDGLADRYVEILGDALKIRPAREDYLSDVDPGFYVTCYVRSWSAEAQLSAHLRAEFGETWFARREAGMLLRELWELGQRPTADELVRDVTGAGLELEAVAERLRARLPAGS